MNNSSRKKVFVGLSGGVDSSVAASILIEEGYEVIGVFIKAWQPEFLPCTWKEDRHSAMRVAASLSIPFETIDLSKEYKEEVFDQMVLAYQRGETPNPDVWCNEKIKFGLFFNAARTRGAEYIATGHYARKIDDMNGLAHMHISVDTEKDQTYFLSRISTEALSRSLFPIGNYTKDEVRRMASQRGLPTADRKDSQGLCFVGALDMKDFLRETVQHVKGKVHTQDGTLVGEHDGAALYTLGERHGFHVQSSQTHQTPYFVIGKNIATNTLTVGTKESLRSEELLHIHDVRLFSNELLEIGDVCSVRFRYRQPCIQGLVTETRDGMYTVRFDGPQERAASGQVVAFYRDDECLGSALVQ